jgi:hypothetical protein
MPNPPRIFLTSFEYRDTIDNLLRLHGIHVDDIVTPGDTEYGKDGCPMENLNLMILSMCNKHNLKRPFVIDTHLHHVKGVITYINDQLIPCGYHIPSHGLGKEMMLPILQKMKQFNADSVFIHTDILYNHKNQKDSKDSKDTSTLLQDWVNKGNKPSHFDVTKFHVDPTAKMLLAYFHNEE